MVRDPQPVRRTTEDLQPRLVGGPEDYTYTTDQPIRYVVVADDHKVLGYLWAADRDDAAGFEPRSAAGDDAFNAGVSWTEPLRAAKARGLVPSQALAELTRGAGGGRMGTVVPGSEQQAPSLAALKELAGRN